jgi:hypothetical protein
MSLMEAIGFIGPIGLIRPIERIGLIGNPESSQPERKNGIKNIIENKVQSSKLKYFLDKFSRILNTL